MGKRLKDCTLSELITNLEPSGFGGFNQYSDLVIQGNEITVTKCFGFNGCSTLKFNLDTSLDEVLRNIYDKKRASTIKEIKYNLESLDYDCSLRPWSSEIDKYSITMEEIYE